MKDTAENTQVEGMGKAALAVLAAVVLAGCVQSVPMPAPAPQPGLNSTAVPMLSAQEAAENFVEVVDRVAPVAERYCRSLARLKNCDFQIVIDGRPGQPANAFHTVDRAGRPILAFTVPLIRDVRNRDELAFVLGHEAAHHIAGHLPQQQSRAMAGAVLAGLLVQASGGGQEAVANAKDIGAFIGARQYSKEFELEADRLGAEIAFVAGFDPRLGAAFFDRIPDPGDQFLGSHPANADRKRVVAQTVAALGGQVRQFDLNQSATPAQPAP